MKQSRKARINNVVQQRNLYVRESESPYLPQNIPVSLSDSKSWLLSDELLYVCENEENNYHDDDYDDDSDKVENNDLFDDDQLYADIENNPNSLEISNNNNINNNTTPKLKNDKVENTVEKSELDSSVGIVNETRLSKKIVEVDPPVQLNRLSSRGNNKLDHHYQQQQQQSTQQASEKRSTTTTTLPTTSTSGYTSYEEYVNARKKAVDYNPYSTTKDSYSKGSGEIDTTQDEDNPYSTEYISPYDQQSYEYTPSNDINPSTQTDVTNTNTTQKDTSFDPPKTPTTPHTSYVPYEPYIPR